MSPKPSLRFARPSTARLGVLVVLLVGVLLAPGPATSVEPSVDGKSVATAAASCWEIKKNDRSAPSGTYWLWTPALGAPQQFHCDMERAGGGWVLIGRGREGWQTTYNGLGEPDALLSPRTDFRTTQLPAQTVDGLLDGRAVRTLREGIRVRRAMDAGGTKWQEVRFTLPQRGRWVWTFWAGHPVGDFSFKAGGRTVSGSGGNSRGFGRDAGYRRVVTSSPENQSYTQGFAYGSEVVAGPDADSFLWSSEPGQGYARPYAEAYIRPRVLTSDFDDIPASGTAAVTRLPVPSTWAAPIKWGVTGLASSYTGEGHSEVQAFAEWEGRLIVGGNFSTVQRGRDATGADLVQQPYLAAFDLESGDFLPGFQTELDGEVKALQVLPGGRLAIGGAFTEVDGQSAAGIAVVDAATGSRDPGFDLTLGRGDGVTAEVRDLELVGGALYVAGDFLTARSGAGSVLAVGNAVRVSPTTGQPDSSWNPMFDRPINDSAPSPDGSRIYFAGHFMQTGSTPTRRVAAIRTVDGALVSQSWKPEWSVTEPDYQRAVGVEGGRVWVGGSQHSLFSFGTDTFARESTSITAGEGGDFQTISTADGYIYAGCHCNAFNYQGADEYATRIKGWSQADKINRIGAWTADGRYVAEFSPLMRSTAGAGVWATLVDSKGALWAGGDLRSVQTGRTTSQWLGGFVRFPLQDHQAPTTPSGLTAAVQDAGQVRLSWAPATDGSGSQVGYEVLRNDRVVAVTDATTVDVPGGRNDQFFVRAVDPTGNRSASTGAVKPS